jgi:hypothetical protein
MSDEEPRAKGKEQRARGKRQRAKSKGQRAKSKGKEQRAKSKGQRAKSKGKEQRAKSKGQSVQLITACAGTPNCRSSEARSKSAAAFALTKWPLVFVRYSMRGVKRIRVLLLPLRP